MQARTHIFIKNECLILKNIYQTSLLTIRQPPAEHEPDASRIHTKNEIEP